MYFSPEVLKLKGMSNSVSFFSVGEKLKATEDLDQGFFFNGGK